MSLYYNFSQANDTAEQQLLDKTDVRLSPIVDRASNYALSVVKFNLPVADTEVFKILNNTDFRIKLGANTNNGIFASGSPYANREAIQSMSLSSVFPMRNIEDVIENFNRSALLAHKALLQSFSDTFYTNVIQKDQTGTIVATLPHTQSDIIFDFNTNTPAQLKTSYVSLEVQLGGTNVDTLMEMVLIDPNGVQCIVSGNKRWDKNNTVVFEDGSLNDQSSYPDSVLTGSLQPVESFTKFCAQAAYGTGGNWTVRLINKNTQSQIPFNITYNITIKAYFVPKYNWNVISDPGTSSNIPRVAPALSISNNKLALVLDDNITRSGYFIKLSPKLYEILGFKATYDTIDGFYKLKLPQFAVQNDGDLQLIHYQQPVSSLYKLIDISEIQIRTNNLPVMGEFDSISNQRIITSINTSSGDLNSNVYEYVNTMLTDRSYELINDLPISDINISVWVKYRSSGLTEQVYLSPHTSFALLLKFIRLS